MSIVTYTNPHISTHKHDPSNANEVIVCHGGGSTLWSSKHILVKHLFRSYSSSISTIHSLQLPFHGTDSKRTIDYNNHRQQVCTLMYNILSPLLTQPASAKKKFLFLAYSVSSLYLLKIWKVLLQLNPSLQMIAIGSALTNQRAQCNRITKFWSPLSFKDRIKPMETQHGTSSITLDTYQQLIHTSIKGRITQLNGWINTVTSVALMTGRTEAEHGIYLSDTERTALFSDHLHGSASIYFISGKDEQPFPPDVCFYPVLTKQQIVNHLTVIDCHHMNYFDHDIFFSKVAPAIHKYMLLYLPLLTPWVDALISATPYIDVTVMDSHIKTYVRTDHVNQYQNSNKTSTTHSGSEWQAITIAGGGNTRWKKTHVMTQLLFEYLPVIHALELPLHGHNQGDEFDFQGDIPEEGLRQLLKHILPVLQNPRNQSKSTLLVGYSMSALSLLKLYTTLEKYICVEKDNNQLNKRKMGLLVFGCSLTVPLPAGLNIIYTYWIETIASNPEMNDGMVKQHGSDWLKKLGCYIAESSGQPHSKLWLTANERNDLFNDPERRVYMIHSTKEWAFEPCHCIYNLLPNEYISTHNYTVHGAEHFEYWNKKYWNQTNRCIRAAITMGFPELESYRQRNIIPSNSTSVNQAACSKL